MVLMNEYSLQLHVHASEGAEAESREGAVKIGT